MVVGVTFDPRPQTTHDHRSSVAAIQGRTGELALDSANNHHSSPHFSETSVIPQRKCRTLNSSVSPLLSRLVSGLGEARRRRRGPQLSHRESSEPDGISNRQWSSGLARQVD